MGGEFRVGDRVQGVNRATGKEEEGTVTAPGVPLQWTEVRDTKDRSSWVEHSRDDGVEVHWDSGDGGVPLPENLTLISRPEVPMARIPHEVRRIEERIIEGDLVENQSGQPGNVLIADNYNGDFIIDWEVDGTEVLGGQAVDELELIERPNRRATEAEPNPGLPEPRPARWWRIDVADDNRTMWIHYHKDVHQRLHSVVVHESSEDVCISLFLSAVAEPDPRWAEALAHGPVDAVPECTRFTLDAPLGERVCYEELRETRTTEESP